MCHWGFINLTQLCFEGTTVLTMNICLYKIWVKCLIKHTAVSTKVMKGTQKVCGPPYSASIFMHPIGFLNLPFKTMTFWDWQLNESFSAVQNSVMSDSLQPQESQCARPPCPSPTTRVYPNPCPLSQWCHPTISSSVPFSSCPQSFPASGSFPMSQLFKWGGQVLEFQL